MRRKARNNSKNNERVIKEKFKEERMATIVAKPIYPMNERQAEYLQAIKEKDLIIATGYAGTSKTYLATCLAADAFRTGEINTIVLARPAVSNSQSLGYFSGDANQKMINWLMPLLSVLYQRMGRAVVDLAISEGNIILQPLETVKGMSFGKGTWVICDETEDCTIDEVKSITSRSGGCKMILCGDILQSALHEDSGLKIFANIVRNSPRLRDSVALIEFDSYEHIVRSKLCKDLIISFEKFGY
jgi:phosphate starvation-inducible protein PhoH and related proteins